MNNFDGSTDERRNGWKQVGVGPISYPKYTSKE